ncbi:MAG: class I SAM-dependent methyltransferase [Deltaproteobacteria bacterium]|nr:class I SAM-dependent methyltransferase [Deltaproteobacteria bacterium]
MIESIRGGLLKILSKDDFPNLDRSVIELNNCQELKKVFGWKTDPILDRPDIYNFDYIEDVNERRICDAESLATVMRNAKPKIALEIGTASGMATVLMSVNAPESRIYTVNIPPEEIVSGEGGKLTTIALEREKIGIAYREKKLINITQIYANTAKWEPSIGYIDVAFIDGCHDADFVYNDTRKILKHMRPGSFILWHDFNPTLAKKYDWINSVCLGVEKLYRNGLLKGRMFHIRDSWIGLYKVPEGQA